MFKIHCKTNLDINESWPTSLPARPVVGDRIKSLTKHKTIGRNNVSICLEVVATTWVYSLLEDPEYSSCEWYLEVELHDPLKRFIRDFYKWYAPLIGKTTDSFI